MAAVNLFRGEGALFSETLTDVGLKKRRTAAVEIDQVNGLMAAGVIDVRDNNCGIVRSEVCRRGKSTTAAARSGDDHDANITCIPFHLLAAAKSATINGWEVG